MSKHTQGKWKVSSGTMVISSDCKIIASTLNLADIPELHIPMEEQQANARLIASAPELLEACKKAERYLHKLWGTETLHADGKMALEDCQQAIAKAEGK